MNWMKHEFDRQVAVIEVMVAQGQQSLPHGEGIKVYRECYCEGRLPPPIVIDAESCNTALAAMPNEDVAI